MRRVLPYLAAVAAATVTTLVAYLVVPPHGAAAPAVTHGPCTTTPIGLTVAVSPEKRDIMTSLTARYNAASRLFDGRCARVGVFAEASGQTMAALAKPWDPQRHAGNAMPQVWIPASSAWIELLGPRPVDLDRAGRAPSIARSPLVLAVPERVAADLGGKISWSDVLSFVTARPGWSRDHPEWGTFKLGKTNPNYSTSGLHATIATYEAVAAARGLPVNQSTVDSPQVRGGVGTAERAVVHYGETTLSFLTNLANADAQGREANYMTAVAVEEKSVYDYNSGRPDGDLTRPPGPVPHERLVALYPSDGTLVSDNPYAILPSATGDQRAAARDFQRFLLERPQQDAFRAVGMRGADGRLAPNLSGTRADATIRELPLPASAVLSRILDSWKVLRKPARVLLALDVSGSMGDDPYDPNAQPAPGHTKLDLVKAAATRALDLFSPQDEVGLWSFSGDRNTGRGAHTEQVPVGRFDAALLRSRIGALQPQLSTALYTTIRDGYDTLAPGAGPDTITALVVLTDGHNEWDPDNDLGALRQHIDASGREYPVRVFTVAYGHDADSETLKGIARSAAGWEYDATDPRSIEQVLSNVISNF